MPEASQTRALANTQFQLLQSTPGKEFGPPRILFPCYRPVSNLRTRGLCGVPATGSIFTGYSINGEFPAILCALFRWLPFTVHIKVRQFLGCFVVLS